MSFLGAQLRTPLAMAVLSAAVCVYADAVPADALIKELQNDLASARSLPAGSRPPPPALRLESLVGLARSKLKNSLGRPTYCEPESLKSCARAVTWKYAWGPSSATPRSGSEDSIEVTTGGPWLLVVDFRDERVLTARWQGQR